MIHHLEDEREEQVAMKIHHKLALQAAKKVSHKAYEAKKMLIANKKQAVLEAKKWWWVLQGMLC